MDPISPPLSTASAIGNDESDLSCLKRKDVLECHICFEPPTDPVLASCGHVFCWPCMYKWPRDQPKPCCPVCRYSLRIDRNIIPLYGGSVGAGPSNGNEDSADENPAASDMAILPRPRNPLLINRLMIEHSARLLTQVCNLETEQAISEREKSNLEHMNSDLRRQVEEKDHRISN